jgi:pimeloyl-ACP methyl ester carboxylesterase
LQGLIAHRQYFLIGHSDGGSISLISAAEQNPLLQGVVTAAAHVFVEPETLLGIEQAQHAWRAGKLQSLIKYHGDKTPQIFSAWANTWRQPWFKHWNIEYLLPSVRVPMLVIQGANDQYASEEQVLSIVEKTAGKSLAKIIENCAHSPHAQAQSKVLEAMQGFINAIIYSQNRITS